MAHNSADTGDVLDVSAFMNSQVEERDVSAEVTSLGKSPALGPPVGLKQEANALPDVGGLGSVQNPTPTQNGDQEPSSEVIDLTRPVKTEGEASPSGSTSVPATIANNNSTHLNLAQARTAPLSISNTTDGLVNVISGGTFGPQMAGLGAQLHLTLEEQATAYKKANIVALSALARKGGPSAKDMLAVQAKLQEFLTSLITLAGKTGPQLKATVQALVQKLVTGTISEEEFAVRIENDLHSQHQPSLLPFLKNSVPHLKTRLQLQQAIMKELLQRQALEKQQKQSQITPPQQMSQQHALLQQPQVNQQPLQLPRPTPPQVGSQLSMQQQLVALQQRRLGETTVVPQLSTASLQQQHGTSVSVSSPQSSVAAPLPSQPLSVVPPTSLSNQALSAAPTSIPNQALSATPTSIPNQMLSRDQIRLSGLTAEQQKMIYINQVRRQQLLKVQQQQQQQQQQQKQQQQQQQRQQQVTPSAAALQSRTLVPKFMGPASSGVQTMSYQAVLEKQQQLVKEQQVSLVMGGRVSPQMSSSKPLPPTQTGTPAGFGGLMARGGASTSGAQQSSSAASRTGFADMKVIPGGSLGRSSSPSVATAQLHARGKSKAGRERSKETLETQEDDDEEEGMDIAGVNLQEETAHFLPQSVGETLRTCKDEVFLDTQVLKQRVAAIGRLYGISEVSEDVLVLLSHATQERLRDCMEKLTAISQHRTEVLKDSDQYRVVSEVRGQLKVLESIDRLNHKRKQDREKEKILRAAKSRSKVEDPEAAAKIKEQAKQLQLEEEQMIRNRAANETALAAIGSRRKRTSTVALQDGVAAGGISSAAGTEAVAGQTSGSLLGAPSTTRQHKRRITSRDLVFYMEQERETRKSQLLYKSLLK